MLSVNERALTIFQRLADAEEAYGVAVSEYENGVTVLDCGIDAWGSLEAGRLFAEICLGGLGRVQMRELHLDDLVVPPAQTDRMAAALEANGVTVEVHRFAGEGHGFRSGAVQLQVLEATEAFFRRHFQLTGGEAFLQGPPTGSIK